MARHRSRRRKVQGAVEVGIGVGILTGIVAHHAIALSVNRSLRAGLLAGAVTSAFWLVQPLLEWLWQKSAWWRRYGEKQWARHLVGIELTLGGALLGGIIAHYALNLTLQMSAQIAGAVGVSVLALWLLRPLWGWVWQRVTRWVQRAGKERGRTVQSPPPSSNGYGRPLQEISPKEFEELCAAIARAWGYEARAIGESGDGGVDVEMWRDGEYIIGQCKRYKGTVPISQVRDFYGAMMHVHAVRGYFFTTGRFSDGAYEFAKGKPLELLDGPYLETILQRLDKRVAFPQPSA